MAPSASSPGAAPQRRGSRCRTGGAALRLCPRLCTRCSRPEPPEPRGLQNHEHRDQRGLRYDDRRWNVLMANAPWLRLASLAEPALGKLEPCEVIPLPRPNLGTAQDVTLQELRIE